MNRDKEDEEQGKKIERGKRKVKREGGSTRER